MNDYATVVLSLAAIRWPWFAFNSRSGASGPQNNCGARPRPPGGAREWDRHSRQRPSTANGGVFATLEDETGIHARKFTELGDLLNQHQTLRCRSLTRPGWP